MDISHNTTTARSTHVVFNFVIILCVSTCCENYSNAPCHHWYNLTVKKLLWSDHLHLITERVSSLRFGCSGWVRPYALNDHTSARSADHWTFRTLVATIITSVLLAALCLILYQHHTTIGTVMKLIRIQLFDFRLIRKSSSITPSLRTVLTWLLKGQFT